MAVVTIPDEGRTLGSLAEKKHHLGSIGIDYEVWEPSHQVERDAAAGTILAAYNDEIARLKSEGGYLVADVISVNELTPGLDEMLARFNREHWHDEDEVRFIISGRGIFHIRPSEQPVVAIEVEAGDLIRVPRGTRHWFNLCAEREIRAIRLFQDAAGWVPHYTETGIDVKYQPVCMGQSDIPVRP
ncbi:MAG TPA: cupin domain-containing protein [Blastocatellia bacterium]|nr:cupin domain-containing protein [Blastocatellia bacterium]